MPEQTTILTRYQEVPANQAYSLQNPGGLILLCTRGTVPHGSTIRYDTAPLAWCTPYEYEPVSKILLVCDTSHKTYRDVQETREFVIALPTSDMLRLVERSGAVSGFQVDKFESLEIPYFMAKEMDIRIPEGVAGWLECSLERIVTEGTSGIVFGSVRRAFALPESWKLRIHYLEESIWYKPGDRL